MRNAETRKIHLFERTDCHSDWIFMQCFPDFQSPFRFDDLNYALRSGGNQRVPIAGRTHFVVMGTRAQKMRDLLRAAHALRSVANKELDQDLIGAAISLVRSGRRSK